MVESQRDFSLYGKSPLFRLFFSLLIILVAGMLLFPALYLAGTIIFGGDFGNLLKNTSAEIDEKKVAFAKYILISQEVSIFIVPSVLILILMKQAHKKKFIDFKAPGVNEIVLVIILAFCLFPITSITGQLNSGLHLPDWLNPVERWMKEKEDYAAQLINLLISSGTFRIMLFNVLMLAVLPAIGEELLFRGVFQKIFYDLFKSGHLAIWVTAFLFSALHFQFYGFIPRFILGLVFGYLFFWGGTLWLPVISHFVNNAVPVIGAYMQGGDDAKNVSGIFSWGQTFLLPVSIVISFTILQYFRSKHKNKSITKEDMSQHTG